MNHSTASTLTELTPRLPLLLRELRDNNSREWFNSHKSAYNAYVLEPLQSLAEGLMSCMDQIDTQMIMKLSRPHRDTRFSADKSPYRTSAWFAFHRQHSEWTNAPAYYFEVTSEYCRYGMGFYSARPATMMAIRTLVQQRHESVLFAMEQAKKHGLTVEGEFYRRPPLVAQGIPDQIADICRRRNIYFCRISEYGSDIFSPELSAILDEKFSVLSSLYHLFLNACEPECVDS